MKSDFGSITSLRKKFDSFKPYKKNFESDVIKASSTTNLCETGKSKKYETCSNERLLKIVKQLKKENKELKKINELQEEKIKELNEEINKIKARNDDSSSRPISCLRNSNSVPKKNRVMFSRDLVQVLNDKSSKTGKVGKAVKATEDPAFSYNYTVKKVTRRPKQNESHSPQKNAIENEYYTPLSCSLQDKKNFSQTVAKHFDISPKFKDKQKLFTKIARF